jgi:hypothetical protein
VGEAISAHTDAIAPGTEVVSCALQLMSAFCVDQSRADVMRSMITQTIFDAALAVALLCIVATIIFR